MNHPFYTVYYTFYGSKQHLCGTPPTEGKLQIGSLKMLFSHVAKVF